MELKTKEIGICQVSAILFALLAASQLLGNIFKMPAMATTNLLFALVFVAGYGMLAYCLFVERRDQILAAGFAVAAGAKLLTFFMGIGNEMYSMNYWYSGMRVSFFAILPGLTDLLGYVVACFVAVALLTEYLPKYKELAKKIWFVPAILILVTYAIALVVYIMCAIGILGGWWIYGGTYIGFISLIGRIICAAAFFFSVSWVACPDGISANFALPSKAENKDIVVKPVVENEAYCGLFKHTLLSMITLGIWQLIWIYRRTGLLNCVEDEPKQTPLYQLLLCMFVPFYSIYWTHRNAQRLEKYVQSKGMECEISTLCLITSLAGTLIPSIIMQDKINACVAPEENISVDENQAGLSPKAQVGLVKHTLLLILTFGVWHFIWIYFATKELNVVNGEVERNPVTKLLLCMFVPFYMIYWYYVSAQRIDKLAKLKGVKSELATWVLILSIFTPVIPSILMQDKVNKLV